MARFKRLSVEELVVLEKQFVQFLAAQSILAEDWEKIKSTKPVEADEIIDDFSDLVYGSVMSEAKYLERKTPRTLYCYQCLSDRFVLIALEVDTDAGIDLSNLDMAGLKHISTKAQAHVCTTEKPYMKSRENEIFSMMELGCEITEGAMFKVLGLLL